MPFSESRWPPAAAVFVFLILNVAARIWLPQEPVIAVPWLLPALEAAVLGVLVFGNPADLAKHRRWLHPTVVALATLMVAAALWATVRLIDDLIHGSAVTNDPTRLLAAGALVWLGNNLSFALLYWLIDSGGPSMRARQPLPADFAFTQHLSPELAPHGWRPVFLDYLHLGFTNATAFSPTDVMPLTQRAKYTMLVQSTVALAFDLAEDDFELGPWIIVVARSGCRSRREEGVGEVAGECPNECNADKHRDRRDHLAGIGHWIYVAVSDSRDGGYSPPERVRPGQDVGARRILLDSEDEHAAELHRQNGEKAASNSPP